MCPLTGSPSSPARANTRSHCAGEKARCSQNTSTASASPAAAAAGRMTSQAWVT